jgi:hypothetical protein
VVSKVFSKIGLRFVWRAQNIIYPKSLSLYEEINLRENFTLYP